MNQVSEEPQQQQTTAVILDEYCRYYSDFSKILGIYIKNFYPQLHFEFEQLLDASFNVWHRLSDEEKISLATFLEEMSRETNRQTVSSSSNMKTFNGLMNSELLATKLKYPNPTTWMDQQLNSKSIPLNTSSYMTTLPKTNKILIKKRISITPFHIYLKDERKKFLTKHSKMSMRDTNKRLSERWKKMSNRKKQKYEQRSSLAKKRLYRKQEKSIQLKKPSFIKRMSIKTKQLDKKNQHITDSSRSNISIRRR